MVNYFMRWARKASRKSNAEAKRSLHYGDDIMAFSESEGGRTRNSRFAYGNITSPPVTLSTLERFFLINPSNPSGECTLSSPQCNVYASAIWHGQRPNLNCKFVIGKTSSYSTRLLCIRTYAGSDVRVT